MMGNNAHSASRGISDSVLPMESLPLHHGAFKRVKGDSVQSDSRI